MPILKWYSPPFQYMVIVVRPMTNIEEPRNGLMLLSPIITSIAGTTMYDNITSSRRHSGGCVGRYRPFLVAALPDPVTPSEARLSHSSHHYGHTTGRAGHVPLPSALPPFKAMLLSSLG